MLTNQENQTARSRVGASGGIVIPICYSLIATVPRSTPPATTFGAILQVTASMKFPACVGDLRNAFCQSGLLVRKDGKLYAAEPRGGIPGLHPEEIVEIVAGMYGLGDAPSHWRRTLKQEDS